MGNKLTDEELAEVRQIIAEHREGVDELEAVRKMIAKAVVNVSADQGALQYGDQLAQIGTEALQETFETPTKTSELLSRAAGLMYYVPGDQSGLIGELRDRAAAFKQIEDTP